MLIPFVVSSSAFVAQRNTNIQTKCLGHKAFLKTPFSHALYRSKYATPKGICFDRSSVQMQNSPYTSYNGTDGNQIYQETSDFEKDAAQSIQELELLFSESKSIYDENDIETSSETGKMEDIKTGLMDDLVSKLDLDDVSAPTKNPLSSFRWEDINPFKNNANKDVLIARVLLILVAALYGTNFPMVKVLDQQMPVGISSSLRFGLAALIALPFLFSPGKKADDTNDNTAIDENPLSFWGPVSVGMEVGLWHSFGYIAQAIGLQTVDASKSAFICSLTVVIVPILDLFLGKMLSFRKVCGISLAVAGVALLEVGPYIFSLGQGTEMPSISTGDIFSFVQPVAFAIGFWRMEKATEKYPNETNRLASSQLLAIGLASVAYTIFSMNGDVPSISQFMEWFSNVNIVFALLWTGLISTALTIYMETVALKTVSASEATIIFSTEPIWGSLFAALIVGERMGLESGLGAALIMGGCLVSTLEQDSVKGEDIDIVHANKEKTLLSTSIKEINVIDLVDDRPHNALHQEDDSEHIITENSSSYR